MEKTKNNQFLTFLKNYSVLFLLLIFIVICSCISDSFLTVSNIMSLLKQCSITGLMAIGMHFVIVTGGIDLSVGSVSAFASIVTVSLLKFADVPLGFALVLGILGGTLFGLLNGIFIVKFKLPAFIMTMASMEAARGLALVISNGDPISSLGKAFNWVGQYKLGPVPFIGILWIILMVVAALILKYSVFGRGVYAIGGNEEAARLSGIRIGLYTILCYVICGFTASVAGFFQSSWLQVGQPTISDGKELDAIAACVIGGASLSGGRGNMYCTFAGVWLMQIITNIFNMLGVSSYIQKIMLGVIIVAALMLNNFLLRSDQKD